MHVLLLERTRELIAGCPCESGCPSCVGPEGNTGPHAKQVASRILDALLNTPGRAAGRTVARAFDMDLKSQAARDPIEPSRLAPNAGAAARSRELTYEPDTGGYEAGSIWIASPSPGRRASRNAFGQCLVIDRRYESDRWHGDVRIGECEIDDCDAPAVSGSGSRSVRRAPGRPAPKTVFIDLETTGLSGGAGTVAFLVGCGYFDLGAFQFGSSCSPVTPPSARCCAAVAEFFDDADLIVTYNGKTFDVPVMETRWLFHRMGCRSTVFRTSTCCTRRGGCGRRAVHRRPETVDAGCRPSNGRSSMSAASETWVASRFRPLLPLPADRRSASARTGARAQPARSGVAGRGHGRAVRLVEAGADGCPDEQQALALGRISSAPACSIAPSCAIAEQRTLRRSTRRPRLEPTQPAISAK